MYIANIGIIRKCTRNRGLTKFVRPPKDDLKDFMYFNI